MTKRERYLSALNNNRTDSLVWAPNFDYWYRVNGLEGTLPEKYGGLARNDVIRAVGGYIWNRADGCRAVLDDSVKETWQQGDNIQIHEMHTPLGSIREVFSATEGMHRAKARTEHFIKDLQTLKIMKYVIEATRYEPMYEPTVKALQETGDDGVVLNSQFCVPFMQYAKIDAGYMNGFYLWADYKDEVDSFIRSYNECYLQGYSVLAAGPADVVTSDDNMDGFMITPAIFEEYVVPFYQEARRILHAEGKIFEGHWCGRTQNLLHLVPGCGLDVVEAIVSRPMADISLAEALDRLEGKVVLQGGIPSVLVCNEGGDMESFRRYIEEVILPLKGRKGFILGMSDNVPPNADFSRVEAVSGLIA